MKEQLEQILAAAQKELSECHDLKIMEELRVKFLGKKGELTAILKQMGGLSAEERPVIGQLANKVRSDIEAKLTEKAEALRSEAAAKKMAEETIDVTLPGKAPRPGRLHPLTATLEEVKEIFLGMGFDIVADTHANWNILEQETGDFTTAKGKEVMQKFLRRYDDIDVLVAQNDDMAFGAIEALKESGRYIGFGDNIRIISFDGGRAALELVKNGEIDVDIECNPEQGETLAEVIHMLERGETVEKEYIVE
ncbi:MAG: substrate-binding domain-containing protein, partial [Oscillospiraceae bacterium]|nr:substrate-binding domain-containing protein [Oscillospiraceae bacterium]